MKSFLITTGTLIAIITINIFYRRSPHFETMETFFKIFLITIFLLCVYFFPTAISCIRKSYNQGSIFIINIFLGWTLIGWIVSLTMACSSNTKKNTIKEINTLN